MMHLLHHVLRTPGSKRRGSHVERIATSHQGMHGTKGETTSSLFYNIDFGKGNDDNYLELHFHPCRNPKGKRAVHSRSLQAHHIVTLA